MNKLCGAYVVDVDITPLPTNEDLVQVRGQGTDLAGERVGSRASRTGSRRDSRVVLIGVILPDLDCSRTAGDNPGTKDKDLVNLLYNVGGLELGNQASSFEHPDSPPLAISASPSNQYSISVGIRGSDSIWTLRSAKEDKLQATAQIVRL